MYYSEELIEEVRSRNDIVDVISGYVRLQKKGEFLFRACLSIMKSPDHFCEPAEADVLLLWMRSRWKCIYIFDGI